MLVEGISCSRPSQFEVRRTTLALEHSDETLLAPHPISGRNIVSSSHSLTARHLIAYPHSSPLDHGIVFNTCLTFVHILSFTVAKFNQCKVQCSTVTHSGAHMASVPYSHVLHFQHRVSHSLRPSISL